MTNFSTIATLTGDRVLYRDLQPFDQRLPTLAQLREQLEIVPNFLPRKRDVEYSRYVAALLALLQEWRGHPPLDGLLVIGDTNNDRMLAAHLRTVTGLPVWAFIGVDRLDEVPTLTWHSDTATATRWSLIDQWYDQIAQRKAGISDDWARLAVLLDIDKTLLGPRGRGDAGINEARRDAAVRIASDLLGSRFEAPAFAALYATLNDTCYHPLTLDNQDYVVYITLLLAAEVLTLDELQQGMANGQLADFQRFLAQTAPVLPAHLAPVHAMIAAAHEAGDPTPFKAFRRAEFAATVERMADGRLVLCREVITLARRLVDQGVLCIAASDKPAESALPSPEQTVAGLLPLHQTPALAG